MPFGFRVKLRADLFSGRCYREKIPAAVSLKPHTG